MWYWRVEKVRQSLFLLTLGLAVGCLVSFSLSQAYNERITKLPLYKLDLPNGRCLGCFQWEFPAVITPRSDLCNVTSQTAAGSRSSSQGRVDIVLVVPTMHEHRAHRDVFREIYNASQWRTHSLRLVFVLGMHPMGNVTLERALQEEGRQFGDLLQTKVNGSYWNMTRMVYSAFRWLNASCDNAKFIVKISDDVVLNIPGMFHLLDTKGATELADVVFGECRSPWVGVIRGPEGHRWAVGRDAYPYEVYPAYCSGAGIMMSMLTMRDLIEETANIKYPNPHDDVNVGINQRLTGHCVCNIAGFTMWSEVGSRFTDAAKFGDKTNCTIMQKRLGTFMGAHLHGISPEQIRWFWTKRHCYEPLIPYNKINQLTCVRRGKCQTCKDSDCYPNRPINVTALHLLETQNKSSHL